MGCGRGKFRFVFFHLTIFALIAVFASACSADNPAASSDSKVKPSTSPLAKPTQNEQTPASDSLSDRSEDSGRARDQSNPNWNDWLLQHSIALRIRSVEVQGERFKEHPIKVYLKYHRNYRHRSAGSWTRVGGTGWRRMFLVPQMFDFRSTNRLNVEATFDYGVPRDQVPDGDFGVFVEVESWTPGGEELTPELDASGRPTGLMRPVSFFPAGMRTVHEELVLVDVRKATTSVEVAGGQLRLNFEVVHQKDSSQREIRKLAEYEPILKSIGPFDLRQDFSGNVLLVKNHPSGGLDPGFANRGVLRTNFGLEDLRVYDFEVIHDRGVLLVGRAKKTGSSHRDIFIGAVEASNGALIDWFGDDGIVLDRIKSGGPWDETARFIIVQEFGNCVGGSSSCDADCELHDREVTRIVIGGEYNRVGEEYGYPLLVGYDIEGDRDKSFGFQKGYTKASYLRPSNEPRIYQARMDSMVQDLVDRRLIFRYTATQMFATGIDPTGQDIQWEPFRSQFEVRADLDGYVDLDRMDPSWFFTRITPMPLSN